MKRLALILLCALSSTANAADVLIEHIPKAATPPMLVAVIEQAFIKRKWTVVEVTPDSVTATITREAKQVIRGRMRISIDGDALVYTGSAKYRTASPSGGVLAYDKPLSDSWVENLRRDIGLTLAAIPDR
jgi:hypothetical protein